MPLTPVPIATDPCAHLSNVHKPSMFLLEVYARLDAFLVVGCSMPYRHASVDKQHADAHIAAHPCELHITTEAGLIVALKLAYAASSAIMQCVALQQYLSS